MNSRKYKGQVRILLKILPIISKQTDLALHGGTAINLFQLNMPRLSVDIDLTYLPVEDRDTSLTNIDKILSEIKQSIEHTFPEFMIAHKKQETKLIISSTEAFIKVEVNQIKRGCYANPKRMTLCSKAQHEYNSFCQIQMVEIGHLYGGKICAALDRQHPRDLFDISYMLKKGGFSNTIKKGFLFYLISSNRPIKEMLFPLLKDQENALENQFQGMSEQEFTYEDYIEIREKLIREVQQSLTASDKEFLLSIEAAQPNWDIYDFSYFPAVEWKLRNIKQLKVKDPKKHNSLYHELKENLGRLN